MLVVFLLCRTVSSKTVGRYILDVADLNDHGPQKTDATQCEMAELLKAILDDLARCGKIQNR
jgi:hypothetical protein